MNTARKLPLADPVTYWPTGVSTEPIYTIGQTQDILAQEFPSLKNASKLRMLEKFGIVNPVRQKNGYRGYSLADLERLRYALRLQRDSYLPLEQIGDNLAILDRGGEPTPVEPAARVVSHNGEVLTPSTSKRLTIRQLMDYTGVSKDDLAVMVKAKLISPDLSSRVPAGAVQVVNVVMALDRAGISVNNLRPANSAANSALDLIANLTSGDRQKNNAVAKERARVQAYDLAQLLSKLVEALISQGVEDSF